MDFFPPRLILFWTCKCHLGFFKFFSISVCGLKNTPNLPHCWLFRELMLCSLFCYAPPERHVSAYTGRDCGIFNGWKDWASSLDTEPNETEMGSQWGRWSWWDPGNCLCSLNTNRTYISGTSIHTNCIAPPCICQTCNTATSTFPQERELVPQQG